MGYLIKFQGKVAGIESPTLDALAKCFSENEDYIESVLSEIPSRKMPNGYGLPCEQLDEVYDIINDRYSSSVVEVSEIDENDNEKQCCKYSLATIISYIFKQRKECGQEIADRVQLGLDMMRNFLAEGRWHYGLISDEGLIWENREEWPSYPMKTDGSIRWERNGKELYPIIWFGLTGQLPIECWTLYDRKNIRETKAVFRCKSHIGQDDWKQFWFCEFGAMNWNVLWNNDEAAITSAFGERCMNEPVNEFCKVRSDCPIGLVSSDSTEDMLNKVRDYCYYMQKKSILEKAIVKAGYTVGEYYADLCKEECEYLLDDGRPNPVYLNDGFCDQLSESLYGDSQAEDIEIDENYFGKEGLEGRYTYYWNVLDRYFDDCEDVDGLFWEGWYNFLREQYGEDWEKYTY